MRQKQLRKQFFHTLTRIRDVVPPMPGLLYKMGWDFVLQHGVWYVPAPWRVEWPTGAPRYCFGNAIMLAERFGWDFVEGYALHPGSDYPVHHAWNSLADGTLVDSTWRNSGTVYRGVVFALGRADEATWVGDSNILDDWRRGWPLFRQRWTGEDFERVWEPSEGLLLLRRALSTKVLDSVGIMDAR